MAGRSTENCGELPLIARLAPGSRTRTYDAGSLMEFQRARILDAIAGVLDEHGLAGTTVGVVCARAKVSSRTFYEVFESREQCFMAVLDEGYLQVRRLVSEALLDAGRGRVKIDSANLDRTESLARAILAGRAVASPRRPIRHHPVEIPACVRDPRAQRARGCLSYVAEHPGASNRQIADGVGIARHDQISTLLSRLAAVGLLMKQPGARGLPNAWTLTPYGVEVSLLLDPPQPDTASGDLTLRPLCV